MGIHSPSVKAFLLFIECFTGGFFGKNIFRVRDLKIALQNEHKLLNMHETDAE